MSCLLCRSDQFRELFRATDRLYGTTDEMFSVVKCANCGLVRLHPTPDNLSRYYPRNYWFRPNAGVAAQLEEIYRHILIRDHVRFVEKTLSAMNTRGPVLDVGCGGGLFLGVLRERGARVVGLDNSPEAARAAWEHNRVPVIVGDLSNPPIAPKSCAVVTMFHVVEHLPDPHVYIRAALDLLQPDGRLIVQVPNLDSWQFKLFGARWNGVDVPRHLNNFRAADLARLLEQCGFRVTRTKLFSWRDNPAGFATSVAPALDPVARNVRGTDKTAVAKLIKDAVYFTLTLSALPFTAVEALCGAGSTIMVEAQAK